jgi:hypothetical protein
MLCHFAPSRRHSRCTAIAPGMALRDARQSGGSTFALLVRSICRPFSISNPEDRVLFVERTFMCLVRRFRANRSGRRFPGLKPWAESSSPLGHGPSGHRLPACVLFAPSSNVFQVSVVLPGCVQRSGLKPSAKSYSPSGVKILQRPG